MTTNPTKALFLLKLYQQADSCIYQIPTRCTRAVVAPDDARAEQKSLYFIGFFQLLGCIRPLADYQAQLACAEIRGAYTRPADMQAAIQYEIDHPHFKFSEGLLQSTQVDYHGFRNDLKVEPKRRVSTSESLRRA